MQLYDNWREILRKAWSIKFIIVAGIFAACEVALAVAGDMWFSPGTLAGLSAAASCCALISRLVAQKDI